MKTLLVVYEQDFIPDTLMVDYSSFRKREASRAILLDKDQRFHLLNVSKHSYHKLPGGGIDDGEDIFEALERELMEEVGCRAEIISEIGTIIEFRNYEKLKQTSYCYLAKQTGEQEKPALEEGELNEGMFGIKANSIDDAIAILSNDKPDNLEGLFIQKRDLAFLKAAKMVN